MRRSRFVALVLAVLAIHGCVTREMAERLDAFASAARMPKRIEVAYVRTLEPEAPPVVAPAPAPSPPKRRVARPRPAKPASAPEPAAMVAARVDATSEPHEDLPAAEPAASSPPPATPDSGVAAALAAAASAAALSDAASAAAPSDAASAAALSDAASAAASSVSTPPASAPERAADAASASPTAAAAAASASAEPFDWPASTRVTYLLTGNYRGAVNGSAQVEWIRVGTHYQVNLDLVVGPDFAPLITRRMSSEGELTAEGLTPSRYDEDTRVMFRDRRRISIFFQPEGVVLANGERRERWPGVQDTASQFIQLTYLFTMHPELLRVGGTVDVPLALARSIDRWTYDVLDEVVVATPFGPLPSFHLKPRRARPKSGELSAEIWFAPQLRYLPVRIRIEQDPQTYLDLVIARKPELASR